MSDVVLYETRGPVAVITLNRPERLNAWSGELGDGYWTALDRARDDDSVRTIVVTGAGRGFCAGADMDLLQGLSSGGGGGGGGRRLRDEHQTYTLSIPKLIVGAINGACAGLGLVQASMMDIRIAAAGAKFTTAFARRGLIAEHGLSWTLPRLCGPANALDLLLSARTVTAEEVHQLGFVQRVVAPESVLDEAVAYAADVAANVSPTSIAVIKRQVWQSMQQNLADSNAVTTEEMKASFHRPDFKEGVQSFVQRRPPEFPAFHAE
ncbi:MAG: enoyl-CoA hydratase-related protein [Acidimicrobiales bacterium]